MSADYKRVKRRGRRKRVQRIRYGKPEYGNRDNQFSDTSRDVMFKLYMHIAHYLAKKFATHEESIIEGGNVAS